MTSVMGQACTSASSMARISWLTVNKRLLSVMVKVKAKIPTPSSDGSRRTSQIVTSTNSAWKTISINIRLLPRLDMRSQSLTRMLANLWLSPVCVCSSRSSAPKVLTVCMFVTVSARWAIIAFPASCRFRRRGRMRKLSRTPMPTTTTVMTVINKPSGTDSM